MLRIDSLRGVVAFSAILMVSAPVSALDAAAQTGSQTRLAALEKPVSSAQMEAFNGSAIAVALDSALKRTPLGAQQKAGVRDVYAARGGKPVWLDGDGLKAAFLLETLEDAEAHALPRARYDVDGLSARLEGLGSATDSQRAALESALSAAFLTYAQDVSSGLLEPTRIDAEIEIYPHRAVSSALLSEVAMSSDPRTVLDKLPPHDPTYRALQRSLAETRAIDPNAWGAEVPAGPSLKYGMRDQRVAALRARLAALGFAPEAPQTQQADPLRVDSALEEAIRRFQADRGLVDDGVVGSRTLEALNQSPRERLAQIAVNMERLRWQNWDLGRRHILVNQAAFTMTLFENDTPLLESRVVVGQARKHRTPEFSDEMEYLVFNPYWNVPKSIAREEILPILKKDPGYLARNNMVALPWQGYTPPAPPEGSAPVSMEEAEPRVAQRDLNAAYRPESDAPPPQSEGQETQAPAIKAAPYNPWTRYSSGYFPYTLRQNPGPGNALGDVKFLFPNHHSIYLHDTPSKKLFDRERRDFSHGCIRVQKPMELAEILLGWQTNDPTAFMAKMLAYTEEKWVTLSEPVQVHLTYRTATLNDAGALDFLPDVYGRDKLVAAALEAAGVALR